MQDIIICISFSLSLNVNACQYSQVVIEFFLDIVVGVNFNFDSNRILNARNLSTNGSSSGIVNVNLLENCLAASEWAE